MKKALNDLNDDNRDLVRLVVPARAGGGGRLTAAAAAAVAACCGAQVNNTNAFVKARDPAQRAKLVAPSRRRLRRAR